MSIPPVPAWLTFLMAGIACWEWWQRQRAYEKRAIWRIYESGVEAGRRMTSSP